jgi:hypothetical protein
MMCELTYEKLRELLEYNPATGIFTRRVSTSNAIKAGDVAGWTDGHGYTCISLLNETWKAHRLAHFYMTGQWPSADIDHKDTDRSNNRWDNLRESTRTQNLANARLSQANTSGLKGASFHKSTGKWRATISVGDRQRYLGLFDCKAAAHFAYLIEADRLHGEFARAS